jgi:transcriptional regulator with XRE-family HTH domain
MKYLIRYQKKHRLSDKELAKLFHVTPQMIHYYKKGYSRPGYDKILFIEKKTHGAIPYNCWKKLKKRGLLKKQTYK